MYALAQRRVHVSPPHAGQSGNTSQACRCAAVAHPSLPAACQHAVAAAAQLQPGLPPACATLLPVGAGQQGLSQYQSRSIVRPSYDIGWVSQYQGDPSSTMMPVTRRRSYKSRPIWVIGAHLRFERMQLLFHMQPLLLGLLCCLPGCSRARLQLHTMNHCQHAHAYSAH